MKINAWFPLITVSMAKARGHQQKIVENTTIVILHALGLEL